MAERTFRLDIVSPDRVVLEDERVTSVVAPGVEGYMGILAGHAPLVTELGVGELRYRDPRGREHRVAVTGGFMQVTPAGTTVLADAAEPAAAIDVERARRALEQALEARNSVAEPPNAARAREIDSEIAAARNRIRVADGGQSH